jgi:vacuolar-type H+-ATPase subunit E/Vma4
MKQSREKEKEMKEKIIQNISKMQSRITDLKDRLRCGVPNEIGTKIRNQIDLLQDFIFSENEYLENIEERA